MFDVETGPDCIRLYSRFDSQGMADFAYKVMSAQRKEFGGHDEKTT